MSTNASLRLSDRIGFPVFLVPGLLALIIFMIGDGIEIVWISNYLSTMKGHTVADAALIITLYGVAVALGSFAAGALSDSFGPRRVMMLGAGVFIVFDILFILVALPANTLGMLAFVYAMRGFGYPLFAYAFLIWILKASSPERQSSSTGWFWFSFALGMQILGSYAASFFLPLVGEIGTLWAGLVLAVIGAGIAFAFIRGGDVTQPQEGATVFRSLVSGLSIIWRKPKVGIGGVVRVFSLAGPTALAVFFLPYLVGQLGMLLSDAVLLFTLLGVFAVIGNVLWGYLGDRIGWRRTVQWIAAPLCAISYLYLYFVPFSAGPDFWLISVGVAGLGLGTSGFVPLMPLVAALAPEEPGAAISVVNFGAGLAGVVGPGLVAALLVTTGNAGVVIAIAALYLVVVVLMSFLRLPGDAKTAVSVTASTVPDVGPIAPA